jgi:hypothetical protein
LGWQLMDRVVVTVDSDFVPGIPDLGYELRISLYLASRDKERSNHARFSKLA